MSEISQGNLVIIGGAEDKTGECEILREFVRLSGGDDSRIVILTTAARDYNSIGREYTRLFSSLGAREVTALHVQERKDAEEASAARVLRAGTGVFFTGGDQLQITTNLGGTEVDFALREAYKRGVVIAGTSAGASAMSTAMIVDGSGEDAPRKEGVAMAPGLGLLEEVVVDQHFAQRGRINRLMAVVGHNPHILGVGIDEDTAIVVQPQARFKVIGSGSVTVVDGRGVQFTNLRESAPEDIMVIIGLTVHVLKAGYGFDMQGRMALLPQDSSEEDNE